MSEESGNKSDAVGGRSIHLFFSPFLLRSEIDPALNEERERGTEEGDGGGEQRGLVPLLHCINDPRAKGQNFRENNPFAIPI